MRRDYEVALRCADRAIELDPHEMVHHHNRGQVFRYWVKDIMDGLLAAGQTPSPEQLLAAVEDKIDQATESFSVAHIKAPESRYPHVSRIQLIIEVSERLVRSARRESPETVSQEATLADLVQSGGAVAEWIESKMVNC